MRFYVVAVVLLTHLCSGDVNIRDVGIELEQIGTSQLAPMVANEADEMEKEKLEYWYDFVPGWLSEIALTVAYGGLMTRLAFMKETLGLEGISVQCVLTYGVVHFSRIWQSRYRRQTVSFVAAQITTIDCLQFITLSGGDLFSGFGLAMSCSTSCP